MHYFPPLLRLENLTPADADAAFAALLTDLPPSTAAAMLALLAAKGMTAVELAAGARALRAAAVPALLPGIDPTTLLDTAGTGGDGRGTFNISTAAALVAAAAGATVVKHGNRSATSRSGSADVLEALGVRLEPAPNAPPPDPVAILRSARFLFCFARLHHPAMARLAPARRELPFPTAFNLLGPLSNPASAGRQLVGVWDSRHVRPMAEALGLLGARRAWVVRSLDGLDEISPAAPAHVADYDASTKTLREFELDPRDHGIPRAPLESLAAATPAESATLIRNAFTGTPGPVADTIALNAAAALVVAGVSPDFRDALTRARTALTSGAAAKTLAALVAATHPQSH